MSTHLRARDLLEEWREAERRWEATPSDDPDFEDVRVEVLRAWMAYQAAIGGHDGDEVILVADNAMRYVAANEAAARTLGYSIDEIMGMTVTDISLADHQERAIELWERFRLSGRQEGEYVVRSRTGAHIRARYLARAHHPVADFHTSRMTVIDSERPET
jgi:PAS domain S-box-containing protein